MILRKFLPVLAASLISLPALASEVNVYSARKDVLIVPLLEKFTETSGIKVNLLTGKAGALLSRIEAEGKATPADVLVTVDAGNLHRAKMAGVLQPINSKKIAGTVPKNLRDPGDFWTGLTVRARPIFYLKDRVDVSELSTYEFLADPTWAGKICIRSSSNIYNQSMVASMIEANGEMITEKWARGLVANFARKPTGGDTDQLRALAAGECALAIANTYYYGRLLDSKKPADKDVTAKISVFWPNQSGRGTHVNVSGAGLVKYSKNLAEGRQFLEFMVSDEAQNYYAEINHEFPVSTSASASQTIASLGSFKADSLNLGVLGINNSAAVMLMDRADWQ